MAATHDRTLRQTLAQIRRTVRSRELWAPGDRLLVACSGGLDSTTAAALLALLRPSLGHGLVLGHVDHGLRADGGAALAVLTELAAQRDLELRHVRLSLDAGADLQGRARTARYGALHELAKASGCVRIVTAHHADDQAETLLMRLSRGAGSQALAGIRYLRQDGVVRPLLPITRTDLAACALSLGLSWREDPSNQSRDYTRNRLRHEVLKELEAALPGAAAGMARSAENMAAQGEAASWWIELALADHVQTSGAEDGGRWLRVPRRQVPTRFAALAALLCWAAEKLELPRPGHAAIDQIASTLRAADGRGRKCQVHGMTVVLDDQWMRIEVGSIARPEGADYPGLDGAVGTQTPAYTRPVKRTSTKPARRPHQAASGSGTNEGG